MFVHTQYKILLLELDGTRLTLPTINGSHHYTLWVLKHKYAEVKLHGIIRQTYDEYMSMDQDALWEDAQLVDYGIPSINPLVNVDSLTEVLVVLGADAVLILHGDRYDEIIKEVRNDLSLIHFSSASMFYNNYVVTLQIKEQKSYGVSPKLHGIEFYRYTNRKRKTFNRYAEIIRKILNVETNRHKQQRNKSNEVKLSTVMRDYYESQLHDFVASYIYKGITYE